MPSEPRPGSASSFVKHNCRVTAWVHVSWQTSVKMPHPSRVIHRGLYHFSNSGLSDDRTLEIDGMILASRESLGRPYCVFHLGNRANGNSPAMPRTSPRLSASERAPQHFLDRSFKHFAYFGLMGLAHVITHLQAFAEAATRSGLCLPNHAANGAGRSSDSQRE